MNKNKKKGFTLVELIVVLAILAILAAMLVPALTGYIDKANEKKVIATARQYYVAAQTVASEAYANGVLINTIVTHGDKIKISIVNGKWSQGSSTFEEKEDQDYIYIKDFLDLSEWNKKDYVSFQFNDNAAILNADIKINGKRAFYYEGQWVVSKS